MDFRSTSVDSCLAYTTVSFMKQAGSERAVVGIDNGEADNREESRSIFVKSIPITFATFMGVMLIITGRSPRPYGRGTPLRLTAQCCFTALRAALVRRLLPPAFR